MRSRTWTQSLILARQWTMKWNVRRSFWKLAKRSCSDGFQGSTVFPFPGVCVPSTGDLYKPCRLPLWLILCASLLRCNALLLPFSFPPIGFPESEKNWWHTSVWFIRSLLLFGWWPAHYAKPAWFMCCLLCGCIAESFATDFRHARLAWAVWSN